MILNTGKRKGFCGLYFLNIKLDITNICERETNNGGSNADKVMLANAGGT
jgi:hypothetical protein